MAERKVDLWQANYPRGLEVPEGWLDCPPYGTSVSKLNIIPIKVRLPFTAELRFKI